MDDCKHVVLAFASIPAVEKILPVPIRRRLRLNVSMKAVYFAPNHIFPDAIVLRLNDLFLKGSHVTRLKVQVVLLHVVTNTKAVYHHL